MAGLLRNPQDAVLEVILRSTSCSFDEISKPPPGMEASHHSLPTLVTCVHWTLQESMDCSEEPSAPVLTDGCSPAWSGVGMAEVIQ